MKTRSDQSTPQIIETVKIVPPRRDLPRSYGLPRDLLVSSVHRLKRVVLLYSVAYTLTFLLSMLMDREPEGLFTPSSIAFGFAILTSLGMLILVHVYRDNPRVALDWGMVYMVCGALGIVFDDFWTPIASDFGPTEVSWACVWIVGFPLLVPGPPRKILLASLTAASMAPLSLAAALLAGNVQLPEPGVLILLLLPNYICAALAVLGARVLYRLGVEVNRSRSLGSYHLETRLGAGGMGEVWRAKHQMLAFPAAIKLIRGELLEGSGADVHEVLQRFVREAKATASLGSPHCIKLFDFGVTASNSFYYVMELLNGLDLKSLVDKHGPLPADRTIHILKQVCHALSDAHHQGLIHRDIKPSNIQLCRLGQDYDFVKVLDFGLVVSDEAHESHEHLTVAPAVPGTPEFMAPEMILLHEGVSVDGRADIYAVGCLAYWLLTGHLVFDGSRMEVMMHHLNTVPMVPFRHAKLEIPEDLERIVMQCLEKDRDRRPPSAKTLAELLDKCSVSHDWTADMAELWWKTHTGA